MDYDNEQVESFHENGSPPQRVKLGNDSMDLCNDEGGNNEGVDFTFGESGNITKMISNLRKSQHHTTPSTFVSSKSKLTWRSNRSNTNTHKKQKTTNRYAFCFVGCYFVLVLFHF